MEKAMAPHSSTLAWKISWMEEPGRLQSMGSLRVRHDWAISPSLFTFMHWRRKWQPTPVFLPGESQGWESPVGCHLWGRTESDTTEAIWQRQRQEYTEELHKKDLHDPDNHNGVITHLEPDILECEVKWTIGSITTNKASGADAIPAELF